MGRIASKDPNSLVGTLIFWAGGEHRELAWDFVRTNFSALAQKQGPSFRNSFASNLLSNGWNSGADCS